MSLFDSGIRPIIDDHLLKLSREVRDYGNFWSASSAGYCMRKVIFERLGVPHIETDDDARKQRIFTSGHIFHEWIQGLTKDAGISIAQELELEDTSLMIRGHIDDLVLVGELADVDSGDPFPHSQQHLILYDYKTRNSKNFNYAKTMNHTHKMQLGTYMYMLRKLDIWAQLGLEEHMTANHLNEARILNISKDDLRMIETQLLWSPELEKEVYSYWSTLNGYWKAKTLPKCTCSEVDGGYLATEKWNPYWFEGEPCSIKLYNKWKETRDGLGNSSNESHPDRENQAVADGTGGRGGE